MWLRCSCSFPTSFKQSMPGLLCFCQCFSTRSTYLLTLPSLSVTSMRTVIATSPQYYPGVFLWPLLTVVVSILCLNFWCLIMFLCRSEITRANVSSFSGTVPSIETRSPSLGYRPGWISWESLRSMSTISTQEGWNGIYRGGEGSNWNKVDYRRQLEYHTGK